MGSTRDMVISFVEGACEDRNIASTNAGLVDRVWLISRPPESIAPRPPLVSAFRLNEERRKACLFEDGSKPKSDQNLYVSLPPDREGHWCRGAAATCAQKNAQGGKTLAPNINSPSHHAPQTSPSGKNKERKRERVPQSQLRLPKSKCTHNN